jgi:hypothetical protein
VFDVLGQVPGWYRGIEPSLILYPFILPLLVEKLANEQENQVALQPDYP